MRWTRLAIVCGSLAMVMWIAWQVRVSGPGAVPFLPGCQFRRFTGLECPGCGMTRATHAALNGRFAEAFALNPLGMILLPLALCALIPEVLAWVSKRPLSWRLRPGFKGTCFILACVLGFWVLRNTPWWPERPAALKASPSSLPGGRR